MGNNCCRQVDHDLRIQEIVVLKPKPIYQPIVQSVPTLTYKNPQRDQNPTVEQEMTRDAYYQSLLKTKGIHQDFILHPEYYQTCVLCNGQYGPSLKPIVLDCGHLLCQGCIKRTDKCLIYNCSKAINSSKNQQTSIEKIQLLVPKFSQRVRQYDITIKVSQGVHPETIEQKVNGTQKLSEITQKNAKIRNILKGDPNAILQIKTNSQKYNNIKDMTFDKLAEKCGLQPVQSGKKNIITYYKAQKGGNMEIIQIQVQE